MGLLFIGSLILSGIVGTGAAGYTNLEQPFPNGWSYRAPYTLSDETLTIIDYFYILDTSINFTLFVACNETTDYLQVNLTREFQDPLIIYLESGENTTQEFLSAGFEITLYSSGTSLGYYWYDSHTQGGWMIPIDFIWLCIIAIIVIVFCVILFLLWRAKSHSK